MKTANLPAIRVEPQLREQIQQVLKADESLSAFIEGSVREAVRRRDTEAQFIARGLVSLEEVRKGGQTFTVEEVIGEMRTRLVKAKAEFKRRGPALPGLDKAK